MDFTAVLLATVLLVQGVSAAVWWVAGQWLGLSRRATRHWLLAAVASGAALSLLLLQDLLMQQPSVLVVLVLVLQAVISTRRGLHCLLRISRSASSHLAMGFGMLVFNLGLCLPLGWDRLGGATSATFVAGLLIKTARESHRPISKEYGPCFARWHSFNLSVAALSFATLGAVISLPVLQDAWHRLDPGHRLLGLVYFHMLLGIMLTLAAGYMVVRRMVRRLEHLSHHDPLTGLFNRRALEHLLAREVVRLQRFAEPFSVLMVDIDHFKRINDRLGHAAGDAVLCAVAKVLNAHARELDRVARVGGEEFCVVLPHTLHEGAMQAAERLREAINQICVPWHNEQITLTVSTGMATADHDRETIDTVIRRADQALYRAKADGRNRVVSSRLMMVA